MQSKTPTTFLRTSYTQTLFFTSRPDAQTRRTLREAGWKWNRAGHWWKNSNQLTPVKPRDLAKLLAPDTSEVIEVTPELATA